MKNTFITIATILVCILTMQSSYAGHNSHESHATKPITANGVLGSIDPKNHSVHITHDPIQEIGWPAMTMTMKVAPTVNLEQFNEQDRVDFILGKGSDGIFMIMKMVKRK